MNILQLKRANFFVYFRLFELTLQFLQQMYVKNVRPVYGAGIWTHESITTRPGNPASYNLVTNVNFI